MSAGAKPTVVCIGSNEESRVALRRLLDAGVRVVGVVTRPAGEAGRVSDYADLHELCRSAGAPTIDTVDVNSPEVVDALRGLNADYIYTLGWSQLFGEGVLGAARRYVVGSHPSLLPYGRGRAPVPWTVIEGLTESAISLFKMEAGADNGPLLLQSGFTLPERADASIVYRSVAEQLGEAFLALYRRQCEGEPVPTTLQDESLATHRAKRVPADGWIDFALPAESIDRLVRAVTRPFPGAYAYHRGRRVTFWRSDDRDTPAYSGTPGQILLVRDGRLLVQAGDRPIWLWDLEAEGEAAPATGFRVGTAFGFRVDDELHRLRQEVRELREQLRAITGTVASRGAA